MATIEQGVGSGVSFALTEEQKGLRELAREFAEKEIRPKAAEYDEHQTHAADVVAKAHEVGLVNVHIPESAGRAGPGHLRRRALIDEEIGWGCTGITTAMTANSLAQVPVIVAGSEEQKKQWLSPFIDAPLICSYAVTEPGAGSDVAGLKTTAVKKGDVYVLNGQKMWITGAGHANWFFIFAKTAPSQGPQGHRRLHRPDHARPAGREARAQAGPARERHRGSCSRTSTFPPRTCSAGKARASSSPWRRSTRRVPTRRRAVGLAPRPTRRGRLREGAQDVRRAVANHQLVSLMIAEMATASKPRACSSEGRLEARSGRRDTSRPRPRRWRRQRDEVATDAVQVFGGNGYMKEYPVEKLMRDAKVLQIYEGTSQIQRCHREGDLPAARLARA